MPLIRSFPVLWLLIVLLLHVTRNESRHSLVTDGQRTSNYYNHKFSLEHIIRQRRTAEDQRLLTAVPLSISRIRSGRIFPSARILDRFRHREALEWGRLEAKATAAESRGRSAKIQVEASPIPSEQQQQRHNPHQAHEHGLNFPHRHHIQPLPPEPPRPAQTPKPVPIPPPVPRNNEAGRILVEASPIPNEQPELSPTAAHNQQMRVPVPAPSRASVVPLKDAGKVQVEASRIPHETDQRHRQAHMSFLSRPPNTYRELLLDALNKQAVVDSSRGRKKGQGKRGPEKNKTGKGVGGGSGVVGPKKGGKGTTKKVQKTARTGNKKGLERCEKCSGRIKRQKCCREKTKKRRGNGRPKEKGAGLSS